MSCIMWYLKRQRERGERLKKEQGKLWRSKGRGDGAMKSRNVLLTAYNRAYLAPRFRHSTKIPLRGTSDTLKTMLKENEWAEEISEEEFLEYARTLLPYPPY